MFLMESKSKSNLEWIKSRMNQISNESNLEWIKSRMRNQISISMRHLSNAYDIYGEFHLRIYRVEIRLWNDTCRELQSQQNTRRYFRDFGDSVSGFWGILFSRYHLMIMSHFRILSHDSVLGFEYVLDVIFDRSIIKWQGWKILFN